MADYDAAQIAQERAQLNEGFANKTQRLPMCICVDSSLSMSSRMGDINRGLISFVNRMKKDIRISSKAEFCLISFGHEVKSITHGFEPVGKVSLQPIPADGRATNLGAAVRKALSELDDFYARIEGIGSYSPWLIIISDGDADDLEECRRQQSSVDEWRRGMHRRVTLKVKCLSMGEGSRTLGWFSDGGKVDRLEDMEVMDFFDLLSRKVSSASKQAIGEMNL